ncbi:hypothetical protein CU7111_1442 [Corynebacterium urealyticum DSM 7111]|nr:hypothetical protein CU7111_1442 [Corynebacterium urealyticum DSM 7111]
MALDTTRNRPRLHPTTQKHRPTTMRCPRRWPRRLLSNQSLLAQHTDSTLPCPCPTGGAPLHHVPATHRRRQAIYALALKLTRITTLDQAREWTLRLHDFGQVFKAFLNEKTPLPKERRTLNKQWEWTHLRVRKAYKLPAAPLTERMAVYLPAAPTRSTRTTALGINNKQSGRRHQRPTQTHRRCPPRQIRGTPTQNARVVPALENAAA